jgi:hypothetical protein
VKAIYVKNNSTVAVCPIEISVWDNNADVAVVKVIAPNPGHSLFEDFFWHSQGRGRNCDDWIW